MEIKSQILQFNISQFQYFSVSLKMDVLFNQELFDTLSTERLERLIRSADNTALEKMVFLYNLIQRYRNEEAGLEIRNPFPRKRVIMDDDPRSMEPQEYSIINEQFFDALTTKQLYRLISDIPDNVLKRISDLGGFAKDELDKRGGVSVRDEKSFGCSKLDRFRGNWIENLTCGDFENSNGFLIFRPRKGLVLYHASDSFITGDPRDKPFWLGSYDNSIRYVGDDGYMNIFRLKASPRLIILSDIYNVRKLLDMSNREERAAIMTVTGVDNRDLSKTDRSFGCKYTDKDPSSFSRFSSRREDAIMANAVCNLEGVDGYILPQLNYCSSGVAYRNGEPKPKSKRMYGEIMMCKGSRFLERVIDPAIECMAGESCDLSRRMWEQEFQRTESPKRRRRGQFRRTESPRRRRRR